MDPQPRRSLAFDLHGTDLADPASLTQFVVAHTIAPARHWWGLPAPQPDEGRSYLVERIERRADGLEVQHMRSYHLQTSRLAFDPLVRALFLFARLFPRCVGHAGSVEATLRHPGTAVLSDSNHLATRPYEAIADLVAGLLDLPHTTPPRPGDFHAKAPNPDALAELAEARQLINQAISVGELDDHTQFVDIGLQRLDFMSALRLDDVLRRDVRRRLVSFTTFEVYDPDDGPPSTEWFERGVFAADVAETIAGLAVLDYSEQLRFGRSIARCAHCGMLMAVEGRQHHLVSAGRPVYHRDCYDAHKRRYWRTYQQRRAKRRSGSPPVSDHRHQQMRHQCGCAAQRSRASRSIGLR